MLWQFGATFANSPSPSQTSEAAEIASGANLSRIGALSRDHRDHRRGKGGRRPMAGQPTAEPSHSAPELERTLFFPSLWFGEERFRKFELNWSKTASRQLSLSADKAGAPATAVRLRRLPALRRGPAAGVPAPSHASPTAGPPSQASSLPGSKLGSLAVGPSEVGPGRQARDTVRLGSSLSHWHVAAT
jgi:hypothetical protein